MRKIILCFVIQQLLYHIPRVESLSGNNFVPVRLGEFPFIATFQQFPEGDYLCGGALITEKHVLTLTRCIEGRNLQSFRILFDGAHAQDTALTYTAASMITYSTWAEINHIGSIVQHLHSMAIVTLTDRVYHVEPVALSRLSKIQLIGTEAQMLGFYNGVLSKATVKFLSDENFGRRMRKLGIYYDFTDATRLYSAADPFSLLSPGDKGTPLLHPHDNSLFVLASGFAPGYDHKHGNSTTEFIRQHQVNTHSSVYYHRLFIHSIIQSINTIETAPVA